MAEEFTAGQMAAEARREASMRKRVYGRWVAERRQGWTQERADRGVAMMEAIAAHFDVIVAAEKREKAPELDL